MKTLFWNIKLFAISFVAICALDSAPTEIEICLTDAGNNCDGSLVRLQC